MLWARAAGRPGGTFSWDAGRAYDATAVVYWLVPLLFSTWVTFARLGPLPTPSRAYLLRYLGQAHNMEAGWWPRAASMHAALGRTFD